MEISELVKKRTFLNPIHLTVSQQYTLCRSDPSHSLQYVGVMCIFGIVDSSETKLNGANQIHESLDGSARIYVMPFNRTDDGRSIFAFLADLCLQYWVLTE